MSDFIKDNFTILFIWILWLLSLILILILTRWVDTKHKLGGLKWVWILVAWRVAIPTVLLPGDDIKWLECPLTYNHIKKECPRQSSRRDSWDSNTISYEAIIWFIIAFLPLIGYTIFKIASREEYNSLEKILSSFKNIPDALEKASFEADQKKEKDNI